MTRPLEFTYRTVPESTCRRLEGNVTASKHPGKSLLLVVAALLAACNDDSNDRTAGGRSTAPDPLPPPPAAEACAPHFNPTAGTGLPGIRIGDNLAATEFLQQDSDKGTKPGSPLDELPAHITWLTANGQRAAWSPDGTRMLYQDAPIGDVIELDLASRKTRELTKPFATAGFLRAQYLPSGDVLLCGPVERDPAIEDDGRFRGELWVHRAPFDKAPVALGESCWEGIAIDRQSDAIAWNISDINFNDADVFVQALTGTSQIYAGRIVYEGGVPKLIDRHRVLDRYDVGLDAIIEAQDFRTLPSGERELIFSAYFHRGGEVMGVNLDTGAITGYSRSPFYEEPEGIHPSGETILVERDRAFEFFPGELDIWRLTLDGSGSFERLTEFTKFCGYGATNPVVAPDGRRFAFQLERKQDGPLGAGFGLLLFDLDAWNAAHPEGGAPDTFVLPPESTARRSQ